MPVDKMPSTHLEADFISAFIDDIAHSTKKGRATGTAENVAVAEKIAAEFKALGLKPGGDNGSYFQTFTARSMSTRNIIGILPGESDEFIVYGAHMDHIGIVSNKINPGADDNASGTTSVVASARAFMKNNVKLKRSIMFILFSGEEMGLLGSIHFVKNPTVPLNKIRYMVNNDMIGRYKGTLQVLGVERSIEGNEIARDLVSKSGLKPKYLSEAGAGGSDHMPFKEKGIPTAAFFTELHSDYHKPSDTIDKINKKDLQTVAGIAADMVYRLSEVDSITNASFAYAPIEVDGVSEGIHGHGGCAPGLVSFEEVQANLAEIKQ